MIPAPPGYVVVYRKDHGPDLDPPILAFDDDGMPLIINPYLAKPDRQLHRADDLPGYLGVRADDDPEITAVMPGNGWCVEWTSDAGTIWSQPIIGWALRRDGSIVALDSDSSGYVEALDSDHGADKFRLFHPEQKLGEPDERPAEQSSPRGRTDERQSRELRGAATPRTPRTAASNQRRSEP